MIHKGWHQRGYLPHLDVPGLIQALTFRLHDSVPSDLIAAWKEELQWTEDRAAMDAGLWEEQRNELRRRIAKFEDAGHGACHLREPEMARLTEDALQYFDGQRYSLQAWCVMPNHVHVLIRTTEDWPVGHVIQSWKRHTAREANRLLKTSGAFWAEDYYDRYIRDEDHYLRAVHYIHQNPVKSRLCAAAEDWQWSSARRSAELQSSPSDQENKQNELARGDWRTVGWRRGE